MKIVTAAEMRQIDRLTSERFGVPSLTLMENAGTAVAAFVVSQYPAAKRIGVICGKGNNGGDGLVIARHLANRDIPVKALLFAHPDELSEDAAAQARRRRVGSRGGRGGGRRVGIRRRWRHGYRLADHAG